MTDSKDINEKTGQGHSRLKELEELNRLAQILGGTEGIQETLTAIVGCSQTLCKADRSSIVLFDPTAESDGQTIIRNKENVAEPIDHAVNMFVAGYILRQQKPFITDDIAVSLGSSKPSERLRSLGPAMAVPLKSAGQVIGMIHHVNSRGGEAFSADTVRVAEIVANMATQFIVRAKVFESLKMDVRQLRQTLSKEHTIIGESEPMKKVLREIARVAPTSANVLIIGETGTGKELTARAIHAQSPRSLQPFIAVNCAAIPTDLFESELFGHERGAFTGATSLTRGKFELADGGTLFLDEVSEMPINTQPKLLRVLEEKIFSRVGSAEQIRVDVRVVAASSKDLASSVAAGEFRDALYHRLNVVPVILPPLRERKSDIPLLAQLMIKDFSSGMKTFGPDALDLLIARQWKGNVRELRNAVERISIFVQNTTITATDLRDLGLHTDGTSSGRLVTVLRDLLFSDTPHDNITETIEKELLQIALTECSGNITQAARLIGIERMAFQRRIEKFGLEKP
jgi:transcriptional regulator with GAF, ATPase, and Fis domain